MATKDTNYLVAVHKGLDESLEKQVAALPEKFNKQRFLQNCMTVLQDGQADFSKCEAPTVVRTLLKGAFLGLDFFNGECYAIPYGNQCQFQTDYKGDGCTAMYDTIIDGTEKLKEYRDFLKNEGMRVKAVFAIFGDGMDNSSQPGGFAKAKKAVEYLNVEEIVTAFISFGGQATQEAKDLGFKNILDVSSSASELRRAFNCLSKSVIENSKSAVSKQDDFFDV